MRDFSNLERLLKLKNEARDINNKLKTENQELINKRNLLIEEALVSFIEELTELSKYGCAGYTGIKLDFNGSSYGDYPEIIHEINNDKFELRANPSGYSYQVVLYNSESGWNWYEEKTKKFIAMNKNMILGAIEKKIVQAMTDYIGKSQIIDDNIKLKKEIEQIEKNLTKITEYDAEEVCPYCDYVNGFICDDAAYATRTITCKCCGEEILLCSLCDMDVVNCGDCPYENKRI